MIPSLRKEYNAKFTTEKYHAFFSALNNIHPGAIDFRLAETPVFLPKQLYQQMISACESIIDLILDPRFVEKTEAGIPGKDKVPGTYGYPQTIVFDYGICVENGEIVPKLVELQGFPSLYAFQSVFPDIMRTFFPIPDNFSQYLDGLDRDSYTELFRKVLLGNHSPEHVVLLEIKPHEQKTRVDFYLTQDMTGVRPICVTELVAEGTSLFYVRDGVKTPIRRIYNRLIFDEFHARTDLTNAIDIREKFDVEWVPHPDWFYRVSKFTMPFISHPSVPETFFLNEVKQLPSDPSHYVLKPLFSFAGQGVVIDISQNDIDAIANPENWILQRKVEYADIIETPGGPAKTEIRIMYLWEGGASRPRPVINLARISKGKMIGTRFNKDKEWVGGTVAFVER